MLRAVSADFEHIDGVKQRPLLGVIHGADFGAPLPPALAAGNLTLAAATPNFPL